MNVETQNGLDLPREVEMRNAHTILAKNWLGMHSLGRLIKKCKNYVDVYLK